MLNHMWLFVCFARVGLKLEKRIEEAVPAGQQLQELFMKLRYDDTSSENVSSREQRKEYGAPRDARFYFL